MSDTKMTRAGAVKALVAGGDAAREGAPVTDCPHDPDSPDMGERFLAHHWRRGFGAALRAG